MTRITSRVTNNANPTPNNGPLQLAPAFAKRLNIFVLNVNYFLLQLQHLNRLLTALTNDCTWSYKSRSDKTSFSSLSSPFHLKLEEKEEKTSTSFKGFDKVLYWVFDSSRYPKLIDDSMVGWLVTVNSKVNYFSVMTNTICRKEDSRHNVHKLMVTDWKKNDRTAII